MGCWAASSGILLYQEFGVPVSDAACDQYASVTLTSANTGLFLAAFACMSFPIIWMLFVHMRATKRLSGPMGASASLRRVYAMQIGFMLMFTATYLTICIAGWFLVDPYSVMYGYIFAGELCCQLPILGAPLRDPEL
ncbi:hypothetical protein HKX48_009399 [Thoreauomyces humboldtii]|nr:hypothetical protein HKX48_009399 [Thoreauomyces humboldtii]